MILTPEKIGKNEKASWDRCDDLPVEADLGTKILKPNEWKRSKFFKIKRGSCVSPKYHTLSVSSVEAEHGFLILKSLKSSNQAVLTNQHLQQQMLVNIEGLEIESFKPHESID